MQKFLKYSSINACAILFKTSILFLTSIVIVKNLGVSSFGLISLVTAYTGLIGYLSGGGLDIGLIKILTQKKSRSTNYIKIILLKVLFFFFLQKIIILLFFISLFYYKPTILESLPGLNIIVYLSFHSFYSVLIQVCSAILKGQGKFKFCLFVEQILFPITSLTFIYFSIEYTDQKLEPICLSMMIAAFLNFCLICGYIWIDLAKSEHKSHIEKISLRNILYKSFPISLVNLVITLATSLTIILAGFFLSESDLGLIAICQRFSFFAHLALMALLPFFNTSIGEALDKGRMGHIEKKLKLVSGIAFFWAVYIMVFQSLYSSFIFNKLEVDNKHADIVFLIFLIGLTFAAYSRPFSFLLMLSGSAGHNLAITMISLFIFVFSTYILAQWYGVVGVALASTLYFIIISALRLILVKKNLNIPINCFQLGIGISVISVLCYMIYIIQQINSFFLSSIIFILITIPTGFYLCKKIVKKLREEENA